jgi:hypothetical protein
MKSKNINSEKPEKILDCPNNFEQSISIEFPLKNKKKIKKSKR